MAQRLPRALERLLDIAIAGGVTLLLAALAINASHDEPGLWRRLGIPLLWALSQGVPLLWRRRAPMLVLAAVVAAALLLWLGVGTRPPPLAVMVALYTVASRGAGSSPWHGLALGSLIGLPYLASTLSQLGANVPLQLLRLGFQAAVVLAAWLAGEVVHARRQHLEELEQRAERLERERDAEARRAVAEEQARIARELHDVIAHNVSLIVVQASAAQEVFEDSPVQARSALHSIETAGREALAELRRLLAAVRPDDAQREPQPTLAQLGELVERVQRGASTSAWWCKANRGRCRRASICLPIASSRRR